MKRLIALFLASALLLTGCPGNDKPTDSESPAETTAAVTEEPSEPAETEPAEQTDTAEQTAAQTKKAADSKETTAAETTAKPAAGTEAQDELPVIGEDGEEPAPVQQSPSETESDAEIPFNDDGVIELPIIPIR